jgi:hypothetical protein
MATIIPNAKTLKSASPVVETATGFVVSWNIEMTMTADDGFTRDYSHLWFIEKPSKVPGDYTDVELTRAYPSSIDEVFSHHYEVSQPDYTPPTEPVSDFNVNNLRSAPATKQ